MNEQTHKTAGTPDSRKEEGRRMTTKSATARSSITNTYDKQKNCVDAENTEEDFERLVIDCRINTDSAILETLKSAGIENQLGMLAETTARAARSILLRAADYVGCRIDALENTSITIRLRFHEPHMLFQVYRFEEE